MPKRPRHQNGGTGIDDAEEVGQAIGRGIDALDLLRVLVRRVGMIDCADTLDDAFAKCLKAYLEYEEGQPIDKRAHRWKAPKKVN